MKRNSYIFSTLIILFILSLIFFSTKITAEKETNVDIREKLTDITDEEKEIIEYLFIQNQEIEKMEREHLEIIQEIDKLKIDVNNLEDKITKEELYYGKNLNTLKEVLRSYQRMGTSSYLEIILDSNSITDFFRRINILQDLAKNTGELLDSIELTKEKLVLEKENLDKSLDLIEEKERQLKLALKRKVELVEEKEEYLRSLEEDREYYEEYLNILQMMMEDLKITFKNISKELPGIIENSDLNLDDFKPSVTVQGIKLTISEEIFNDVLGENPTLADMKFKFKSGEIIMEIPQDNLIILGNFEIIEKRALEFIIREGKFYDFILEKETIEELLEDRIIFDFQSILYGETIKSIDLKDGKMELVLTVKFF